MQKWLSWLRNSGASALILLASQPAAADPPYGGTVYAVPDQMTERDPTRFAGMSDLGLVAHYTFDHRADADVDIRAYGFQALYNDDTITTIFVNAEYGSPILAAEAAVKVARIQGQMPRLCRAGVEDITLHETGGEWSAWTGHITIHMGEWDQERRDGALEESLLHECAHAVIDPMFEDLPEWKAAQDADGMFISEYAQNNPGTEDIAETLTLYHGLAFHPFRFPDADRQIIEDTIPNRLAFFQRNLTTFDLRP